MSDKYYKVWLHLEEITKDKDGKDETYTSLDQEISPLPFGIFETKDKAIETMEQYHYLFNKVR